MPGNNEGTNASMWARAPSGAHPSNGRNWGADKDAGYAFRGLQKPRGGGFNGRGRGRGGPNNFAGGDFKHVNGFNNVNRHSDTTREAQGTTPRDAMSAATSSTVVSDSTRPDPLLKGVSQPEMASAVSITPVSTGNVDKTRGLTNSSPLPTTSNSAPDQQSSIINESHKGALPAPSPTIPVISEGKSSPIGVVESARSSGNPTLEMQRNPADSRSAQVTSKSPVPDQPPQERSLSKSSPAADATKGESTITATQQFLASNTNGTTSGKAETSSLASIPVVDSIQALVEHVRSVAIEQARSKSPATHIDWARDDDDSLPDLDDWIVKPEPPAERQAPVEEVPKPKVSANPLPTAGAKEHAADRRSKDSSTTGSRPHLNAATWRSTIRSHIAPNPPQITILAPPKGRRTGQDERKFVREGDAHKFMPRRSIEPESFFSKPSTETLLLYGSNKVEVNIPSCKGRAGRKEASRMIGKHGRKDAVPAGETFSESIISLVLEVEHHPLTRILGHNMHKTSLPIHPSLPPKPTVPGKRDRSPRRRDDVLPHFPRTDATTKQPITHGHGHEPSTNLGISMLKRSLDVSVLSIEQAIDLSKLSAKVT